MPGSGIFRTGVGQADNQFNGHVFYPAWGILCRVVYCLRARLTKFWLLDNTRIDDLLTKSLEFDMVHRLICKFLSIRCSLM
ncbi:hypothetical protein CSC00_4325 [Klebsiella pneumoniae]|nr:hypothetical protein CSC00_4325 [Klebsiella pneumoniae]